MSTIRRAKAILLLAVLALTALLWTPAPVAAEGAIHIVRRGENLTLIARRYGTSVSAFVQANGLRNRNFVWVGQRLHIPGSSSGGSSGSTGGGGLHIVSRGENLSTIAQRYGTTVSAFVQANGLRNSNFVWVGQRLRIPGSSSGGSTGSTGGGGLHIVSRGENLSTIARRYGTTVGAIMQVNGLRNGNFVWVGQRLRIPGGTTGGGSSGGSTNTGATSGRWIEIILSSQRTVAWQGNTRVRTMVVSTGIARYPTPTGRFRILRKYPSVAMSGPGYYLPGVPHSMFFYGGYAIHGTYWHNNFGRPMSHGCVNLTRGDAAWLYYWAPVGTPVVIHW
jgi:LysM repeat protein